MKVGFLVRLDFQDKFGGDTFQIKQYAFTLEKKRCSVEYIDLLRIKTLDLKGYDLLVLVNLDRPFELLEFSKYIERDDLWHKTIIIPIHHSLDFIDKHWRYRIPVFYFILNCIFGSYSIDKIKNFIFFRKILFFKNSAFNHIGKNYKKEIKEILDKCSKIICIANGEMKSLENDFEFDKFSKCIVVRNGVTRTFSESVKKWNNGSSVRDIDVLVSGRIEPRKNQIRIIKALIGTQIKVVFIGDINKNNNSYGRQFLSLCDRHTNFHYAGKIPTEDIVEYYLRSKVHLSASWFEVSSLVDLEAYVSGCFIISSQNGYSHEMIKPYRFLTISPTASSDDIKNIVFSALHRQEIEERVSAYDVPLWEESGNLIYEEFKKVCNTFHY